MDEIRTFTPPCSPSWCLCLHNRTAAAATKPIHVHLEYELGNRKFEQKLVVNVPVEHELKDWFEVVHCAAREFGESVHTTFVTYRVQLDGANRPYTFWRKLQDWWHRATWRGTPFTRSWYVPIWSGPIPAPR